MLLCGMRLFWNKSDKTSKRGKNINNTLGFASWYVPFFVVISAAPHDMCPFWFLFRLRLMIYALFGSYFGCASWYLPLSCSYFGCASWYVPFLLLFLAAPHDMYPLFVLISAAPHDMCPFLVLISAAPHDMYPFWFLFRLRLMICALFGSYFSCASWYVPFFGSYFGCASWYVPFFVLISAAPHNMRLFFVLITSQRHLWSIVTDARRHGMYVFNRVNTKLITDWSSLLASTVFGAASAVGRTTSYRS